MALKSAQHEPERAEVIEEALDELDKALDRLRVMYEQYFLGIQKQAPAHLHLDCERKIRELAQLNIRNTGLRYRYNTLTQKFGSYNSYWRRTVRQIENGTYFRNLSKVGRKAAQNGEAIPEEILAAMPKRMREQVKRDREAAIAIAKRRNDYDPEAGPDLLTLDGAPDEPEDADGPAMIREAVVLPRRDGAHVLVENDDFDLDAFLSQAAAEEAAAREPAVAAKPAPTARPSGLIPGVRATAPSALPSARTTGPQPIVQPAALPSWASPVVTDPRDVARPPTAQPVTGAQPVVRAPTAPQPPPARVTGPQPVVRAPTSPQPPPVRVTGPQPVVRAPTAPQPPPVPPSASSRVTGSQPVVRAPTAPQPPPVPASASSRVTGQQPVVRPPTAQHPPPTPPVTGSQPVVRAPTGPQPPTVPPARVTGSQAVVQPPAASQPPATRTGPIPPLRPAAPSQVVRPNPIAPGSTANRAPVPVQSVGGRATTKSETDTPAPTLRPPPGMTDADVNALYSKYVKAKELVGEAAGPQTREKLLRTINAQAPKIMEQYKAKGVDFSIVVKDNQVIIRAKPKP